jgi:ketosteroid isomerase-like protein
MSQENVEAFKRALDAGNRRDVEALLEELDPEVEWHVALPASGTGGARVYPGHEGVREFQLELDETFDEIHIECAEIRDLGDRVLAIGHIRMTGKASGAETESPIAYVMEFTNGKAIRLRAYLDPNEALEAVGLSE